jgi:hypothetical protein
LPEQKIANRSVADFSEHSANRVFATESDFIFIKGGISMEISLNLEQLIGEDEERLLKSVLGYQDTDELTSAISRIVMAAISEYLEMILGKQLPTRANEIRERKLFLLIKHYFVGRIPNESEVSALFQLTESSSRTLLRDVRTKYKYELEEELLNSIKALLRLARNNGSSYTVAIQSDNLLEELKQTVSIKAPYLDQITKVKNSVGAYTIPEDTFEILCNTYGVNISQLEAAPSRR